MGTERSIVLVVDDEEPNLDTFRRLFRRDFDIVTTSSAGTALEHLRAHDFDAAVVDFSMPAMDGLALLEHARELRPDMGRIVMTAFPEMRLLREAAKTGLVAGVLEKPFAREAVLAIVQRVRESRQGESTPEPAGAGAGPA